MVTYRIKFEALQPGGLDSHSMRFRIFRGEHQRTVVGPWAGDGMPDAHLARILKVVQGELRADQIVVDGTSDDHRIELDVADYSVAADLWSKQCAWHREIGRDLFCSAVHIDNYTSTVVHDLGDVGTGYETDLGTCNSCEIPDERLLCAAFSHAKVYPMITMGPGKYGHPERIWSASCRLGNNEIQSPEDCRPGKNHCWHQTVEVGSQVRSPTNGLHLLEAFDFLDSEWRQRYPNKPLVIPTSLAEAAQLVGAVQTRADFENQVVRLGELLQKMKVDGGLFRTAAARGALERLAQWCDEHAPEGASAVAALSTVNKLRNALSHTDRPKFAAAMDALGVAYPPESWEQAWQDVMVYTETALRDLRRAVRAGQES